MEYDCKGGNKCLYVPGRNGKNKDGIGAVLRDLGWEVYGPDLDVEFCSRPFQEQVEMVYEYLVGDVGMVEGPLIAKSYGAYLLLHANHHFLNYEMRNPPTRIRYPNICLLFAPLVGCIPPQETENGVYMSRLPKDDTLLMSAFYGRFPAPRLVDMHIGESDFSLEPVKRFTHGVMSARLNVVPGKGHSLGDDYEREVLEKQIGSPPDEHRWRQTCKTTKNA